MKLSNIIRTQRSEPRRTWDFPLSGESYKYSTFWLDLILNDEIYNQAMIKTERQLIDPICKAIRGRSSYKAFIALGPGDGCKELTLREALGNPTYIPIDINKRELAIAVKLASGTVRPIHAEFRKGLKQVKHKHPKFVYLGSTYSNFDAFPYDLLATIDRCLEPGDAFYASAQTCPTPQDLPILFHQYDNQTYGYRSLTARLASAVGVTARESFLQFNPMTQNLEIAAPALAVSGVAKEIGVKRGDTIITFVSHKPKSLRSELDQRLGSNYDIESFWTKRKVYVGMHRYFPSHFEGAILTKR